MTNQIDVPGLSIRKRNTTIQNLIKRNNKHDHIGGGKHEGGNTIEGTNAGTGVGHVQFEESVKDDSLNYKDATHQSNNLKTIE